jgi:Fe-S-cluster-containing dehydrogenase component
VLVDDTRCIGCAYCVQACPYGSRFIHPVSHTASKCTWCYHRTTKGLKPACVEVCPTGTRMFGDMKREGDPVRHAIEHERVGILQGHHLTEPQCFYLHLDKEVR